MKRFLLILLSLIFCLSLVACNKNGANEEIPVGTEVGNKLPDLEVSVFDENGLTGEKINPSKTGKVTIVNFWGTWCVYCLRELPYFDEIASEYSDSVSFVAIHSVANFSETAVDYVNANYKDSNIIFAKDTSLDSGEDRAYSTLGGEGYYPYTLILDANGVITYKTSGQIPESVLISEIEKALGN